MSHPSLYSLLEAEKKSQQQAAFDPARLLSGFGSSALRLQQPSFINHTLMGNNQLVGSHLAPRVTMPQPLMVNGLALDPVVATQLGMAQYLHGAGTRKNATRESTAQLKNWLKEHQKNPYPTKAEKIMLALYSGMTLTQVSTWFANARRRLKKENKWSPDAGFEDDEEKVTNDNLMTIKAEESGYSSHNDGSGSNSGSHPPSSPLASPTRSPPSSSPVSVDEIYHHQLAAHVRLQHDHHFHLPAFHHHAPPMIVSAPSSIKSDTIKKESEKPQRKIWSLAEMSSSSNSNMSEDETSDNEEVQVN